MIVNKRKTEYADYELEMSTSKLEYLRSVRQRGGKCNTEIRMHIGLAKYAIR